MKSLIKLVFIIFVVSMTTQSFASTFGIKERSNLSTSKTDSANQTLNILSSGVKIQMEDSLVVKNIKNAKSASIYKLQKMKLIMKNGSSIKGRLISVSNDSIVLNDGTLKLRVEKKNVSKIIVPGSIEKQIAGFVVIGAGIYVIAASGIVIVWSTILALYEPTVLWVVPIGLATGTAGYGITTLGSRIAYKRFNLEKNWQIE